MGTFTFWALLPFIQVALLYAVINRLSIAQQDSIIRSARYWRIR